MTSENTITASMKLSRSVLRGSQRVASQEPPLLRNETSNQSDDQLLELPVPNIIADDAQDVRILHVDDDADILELSKLLLERADDDFTVVGETSAVEGINSLQDGEFDCIISDYDMPNTNGLEFLEIVREQHPDIPFILYTAKGSEEVASEAISAGVTEYMQKESGTDQYEVLANRVRKSVERYRSQQQFWDALSWYHRIVEQDLAGVFIVRDEEFVYVNEQLADYFGAMQCEILEKRPPELAHSEEDEQVIRKLMDSDGGQRQSFTQEFTGAHADGSPVVLEIHGGSICYDDQPACIGIVWPAEDAE